MRAAVKYEHVSTLDNEAAMNGIALSYSYEHFVPNGVPYVCVYNSNFMKYIRF